MSIYLDGDNQILTNIPTPPPDFINLTEPFKNGFYLGGHPRFNVRDIRVTNMFHRQISRLDEFLLGVLTVLVISLLTDFVQAILLRTSNDNRVLATNLIYAAMVDEIAHLRNIWKHYTRFHGEYSSRRSFARQRTIASIVILGISVLLFSAEVIAILVTQPMVIPSKSDQYNVQGIQPVGAEIGVSKFIRRTALQRICVSPIFQEAKQQRNFLVSTCFIQNTKEDLPRTFGAADSIAVKSWYHKAGSDHEVIIGTANVSLRIRSQIFTNTGDGNDSPMRIFYENQDNKNQDMSRYLHRRLIYAAMEWSCAKKDSQYTCQELVDDIQESPASTENRTIILWKGKDDSFLESVVGAVSTFRTKMISPISSVEIGIRELITSSAIKEVEKVANYALIENDEIQFGREGLLSEEGRVAGVMPLCVIVIGVYIVVLIIRCVLKPISLAHLALEKVQDVESAVPDGAGVRHERTSDLSADAVHEEYDLGRGTI